MQEAKMMSSAPESNLHVTTLTKQGAGEGVRELQSQAEFKPKQEDVDVNEMLSQPLSLELKKEVENQAVIPASWTSSLESDSNHGRFSTKVFKEECSPEVEPKDSMCSHVSKERNEFEVLETDNLGLELKPVSLTLTQGEGDLEMCDVSEADGRRDVTPLSMQVETDPKVNVVSSVVCQNDHVHAGHSHWPHDEQLQGFTLRIWSFSCHFCTIKLSSVAQWEAHLQGHARTKGLNPFSGKARKQKRP